MNAVPIINNSDLMEMRTFMDPILAQDAYYNPSIWTALAAAIASIIASILAKLGGSAYIRFGLRGVYAANVKSSDPLAEVRIPEAKDALKRQQILVISNRLMLVLLTVGQYIVGGLLATSFVQDFLPRSSVGVLGLLVLVSSLLHQHFRPDAQLLGAMERVVRLRTIIREAEDAVWSLGETNRSIATLTEIRKKVSDGLAEIELLEIEQVTKRYKS